MCSRDKEKKAVSDALYYAENKEIIAAKNAIYRAKNKDKIAVKSTLYRAKNKEKLATYQAAYQATYHVKNKEKIAAQTKSYRESNKNSMEAYLIIYRAANKEKLAAQTKSYRESNKDNLAAYRAGHLQERRLYKHTRRARLKSIGGVHTVNEIQNLLELQKWKCAVCSVSVITKYHIDHILPIKLGGSNDIYNIQILCPTCNLQKSAKHPVDFMQSRGYLF